MWFKVFKYLKVKMGLFPPKFVSYSHTKSRGGNKKEIMTI